MVRILLCGLLILGFSAIQSEAAERTYTATLIPNENVFGGDSRARGLAKFKLSADGKKLHYRVEAYDVGMVSQIHLHAGVVKIDLDSKHSHLPPDRGHGETIAYLLKFIPAGLKSGGTVAEGTITVADLKGELKDHPMIFLADHLDRGWLYVNVHVFEKNKAGGRPICCPDGVSGVILPD